MNCYQLELAEIDRRYQLKVRIASLVLLVLLVVAAAWSAGFSPTAAWDDLRAWVAGSKEAEAHLAPDHEHHVPLAMIVQDDDRGGERVDVLNAAAASESAPPRRLYLVKTSPGRNPHEGTARIGPDPRAPQTYVAGAILLNGGRLAEIHREYVLIERNGEQLRLALASGSKNGAETPTSDLAFVGGLLPESTNPEIAVDWLSEILRMSPVYENYLLVGMQVYPGTRSESFHQLGLRSGDIVVAIDGSPVFDPAAATQLFEPLINGASMTLSAHRNREGLWLSVSDLRPQWRVSLSFDGYEHTGSGSEWRRGHNRSRA